MNKLKASHSLDFTFAVTKESRVSALWRSPAQPTASFVFAHGAGAGMTHAFMSGLSEDLCQQGIATLRYQFPYMEQGSKRPDAPPLCHLTIRAAVREANRIAPRLPIFAGGKSLGGRMTSQAQAIDPLPDVQGLIFVGFPLHPAKKPDDQRARHLREVRIPMLFLQGDRDALADLNQLKPVVKQLGSLATLNVVEGADHAFHVPVRSGRTDLQVRNGMAECMVQWIKRCGDASAQEI